MCYKEKGHGDHPMEKLGLDIDNDPPSAASNNNPTAKKATINAQEARRQSIERCIKSLEHATYCDDKQCQIQSCIKMKKVVSHAKNCKRKNNQGCPICRQLIALCCFHAKSCSKPHCSVPYCHPIKAKLQQQQLQQKLHQRQILRRRIALMNRSQQPPAPPPPPQPQPTVTPGGAIPPIKQSPSPMRSLANTSQPNTANQIPLSSLTTAPPPNAMVSTPIITQQTVDMSSGMKPNMPMGMGGLVPTQPRFVGPSSNFQPVMSVNNMMASGSQTLINPMAGSPNEWAMLQAQRQNQMVAAHQAAQLNNMAMMPMGGMQQAQNIMAQVQPNMQNQSHPSQMTPQLMQQLMQAMRSVNNPNIRNNPQFINALIRSQKAKQPSNNFMPGMNNLQGMQPGQNPVPMSNQWRLQQQKRLQMQRQMMGMNASPNYSNQLPNQQGNPRIINRQFPQDMPPPGPNMIPNQNQPSQQMLPGVGGRITPGMSTHQMMSPPHQSNQQITNHSPRPVMSPSPSMRAPSPCPVMSPNMTVQSPIPNQSLTSPMHSNSSPAQHSSQPELSATIQQPSSVHSDRGGVSQLQTEIAVDMEPEVEDPSDMLSNFVDQL